MEHALVSINIGKYLFLCNIILAPREKIETRRADKPVNKIESHSSNRQTPQPLKNCHRRCAANKNVDISLNFVINSPNFGENPEIKIIIKNSRTCIS